MGDQSPKVSIIIPSYNHIDWVGEALVSVFKQSFTDWELIIIDDASTDGSQALIEQTLSVWQSSNQYKAQSIQFRRHSVNQGADATLNEGLSLGRGRYLAILNSDDVWAEQRLGQLFAQAEQHDLDFLATAVRLWDQHSQLKDASEPDWLEWYQGLFRDWQQNEDFLHTLLCGNFLITTSNFFFRRSFFEKLGGFAEWRYVHDYEYALRLYTAGAKMACLWEESLLNYRLHDSNTIRERPLTAIQENIRLLLAYMPKLAPHLSVSHIEALQFQLKRLNQFLNEEWATEVHYQLVAKEDELLPLIEDRDSWLTERDQVIEQQQQHIQDRDEWLSEREGWIRERDQVINELQAAVSTQQVWLSERDEWLGERDELIRQRDQWVADRDSWIQERDQLIRQLQADYDDLVHSRSHRLGAALLKPFRLLRVWVSARKWRPKHA